MYRGARCFCRWVYQMLRKAGCKWQQLLAVNLNQVLHDAGEVIVLAFTEENQERWRVRGSRWRNDGANKMSNRQ